MVTGIVVTIHVLVSLLLIALILMHSARGGGLSDMFGGVGAAAGGSTVMERNLNRITVAMTFVWTFTTLILAIRLQ